MEFKYSGYWCSAPTVFFFNVCFASMTSLLWQEKNFFFDDTRRGISQGIPLIRQNNDPINILWIDM